MRCATPVETSWRPSSCWESTLPRFARPRRWNCSIWTPTVHAPAFDSLIQPGMTMEEIEKEAIRRALTQTDGRRTEAAQMLGLSVRTLQRKIKEYDLDL